MSKKPVEDKAPAAPLPQSLKAALPAAAELVAASDTISRAIVPG
jgi:hypothetical protein